ncbi:General substrate transporter [Cinnamomum micranthum f. kanehirae]|uniref:General substrate transporter n=1 Tax=Cinnamomum micranthum f. kanehirae TaxID=337451 RepID=A0A443NIG5_9MAGN|nr:General substrate transporter [Cinnamomum micranthum f. kanehirae]
MARLRVLSALDTARTQFYHFKAIIIAGMGLFTDAYDLFCISPVMILIGRIYYADEDGLKSGLIPKPGLTPPEIMSTVVAIALLGTVVGQLIFGWLGDRMGRRKVYGLALLIMVSSSIGSGFSICRTRPCVLTSLCFFRFWLGVGIGGDYPLSATIMSEFANKRTRGSFIAAVFSMQGFGILASSAVTLIVTTAFNHGQSHSKPSNYKAPEEADLAWRLILMFGAVPAVLTYYWRMMMPETARYTALVEQNIPQAVKDMEKLLDISLHQISEDTPPQAPTYSLFSKEFLRRNGRNLFGCAASWFLVDIVFYCSNLFQSKIYDSKIGCPEEHNAYREAFLVAKLQAIIAACSTIPGYWATVFLIDRIGRVKIQMMGFLAMSLCLFALGIPYYKYWNENTNGWFFFLYGLTFFFSNLGPNTTTFIVPAELFPARFRSTCHGLSGAMGKVGAIIGSVGFLWASHASKTSKYKCDVEKRSSKGIGMENSLVILGVICVLGFVLTFFFIPETNGRSLEDNENEEETDERQMIRRSLTHGSAVSHQPTSPIP